MSVSLVKAREGLETEPSAKSTVPPKVEVLLAGAHKLPETVRLVVEALIIVVLLPIGFTEKILFELLSITCRPLAVWLVIV